ncbi:unnamed protein product [Vicia faba]|uniref:Protein BIG GRAIN 1-like B n=1 Tax=Vicia faba TaxID=3906 RepID=A0AAV1AEU0_VICFA|nr:unnamed protein product [Vicia faba]
MEKWNKPSRDHRKQHQRENPSFSSTLLDVIYRSIDEGHHKTEEKKEKLIFYKESTSTMRKMKSVVEGEKPNFRKTRKVENLNGRNSLTEYERTTRSNSNTLSMHSSSSSSESSSAGGFSSSDSESFYGLQKPKPIRTSVSEKPNIDSLNHNHNHNHFVQTQNPKNENGFGKTKSKALRILYGDLKKSKQPISPGARLASFLNSLFTSSGNTKKSKVSSSATKVATNSVLEAKSAQTSTCSSVSSFSRSCLSKTPSSRSGTKRSVRFCPVSVIVDEDCKPCGHKNLHEGEKSFVANSMYDVKKSSEELRLHVIQESRRVEELARDLLKNYQKKNEVDFDMKFEDEDDDDDDDDDGASCSSSDLFELDNLSVIGIERYREELPVYETTHFNSNRVIANGFIM